MHETADTAVIHFGSLVLSIILRISRIAWAEVRDNVSRDIFKIRSMHETKDTADNKFVIFSFN